jgi:hypothetical protein
MSIQCFDLGFAGGWQMNFARATTILGSGLRGNHDRILLSGLFCSIQCVNRGYEYISKSHFNLNCIIGLYNLFVFVTYLFCFVLSCLFPAGGSVVERPAIESAH